MTTPLRNYLCNCIKNRTHKVNDIIEANIVFDLKILDLDQIYVFLQQYDTNKNDDKYLYFIEFCKKLNMDILGIECCFNKNEELIKILFDINLISNNSNKKTILNIVIYPNVFTSSLLHNYYILQDEEDLKCQYPLT